MSPWSFVFILLVLGIQYDDQHLDGMHIGVHLNVHPHHDHVCHPVFDMDHLKCIKMNDISGVLGRHVDPRAPLSNIDLAKLLMNDTCTKVRDLEESFKENEKLEREHNRQIIENVVTGLCKRINTQEEFILNCKNNLTKTLEDLDLKVSTVCSYQEHLINKLHDQVHDLSVQLKSYEKLCETTMNNFRCELCESFFNTAHEYINHIFQHHTTTSSFPCLLCGEVFRTEHSLRSHMNECTPGTQFMQPSSLIPSQTFSQYAPDNVLESISEATGRNPCCDIFPSEHDSQFHVVQAHGHVYPCDKEASPLQAMCYTCNFCKVIFESQYHLQLHIRDVHNQTTALPNALFGLVSQEISYQPSAMIPGPGMNEEGDLSSHVEWQHSNKQVYPCNPCDDTSQRTGDLQIHTSYVHEDRGGSSHQVNYGHTQDSPNKCYICNNMFPTHGHMQAHIISVHGVYQPNYRNPETHKLPQIHCRVCEQVFSDMRDLNIHTNEHHNICALAIDPEPSSQLTPVAHSNPATPCLQCQECDKTFLLESDLEEHVMAVHTPCMSPIAQLDGNDSIMSEIELQVEHHPPEQQDQTKPVHTVHTASYFLNRKKQSEKICKDASKDNMEVTTNNRNQNVNIQCSLGFYLVVARPCISSLTKGSTSQVSEIQITCKEEFLQVDKSGAPDFTRLTFELKGHAQSVLGKVVLHLHHTTRLVQVQGSAKMPDKSTAAVWFAEHFLSKKFQELARTRQFDIASFNNSILEMSRLHHNSVRSDKFCAQCTRLFSPSSKPISCPSCQKKIHTGCSRTHLSFCSDSVQTIEETTSTSSPTRPSKRTRTSSITATTPPTPATTSTNPPAFLNTLTAGLITSGVPTFTGRRALVSFVPAVPAFTSTSECPNITSVSVTTSPPTVSYAVLSTSTSTVSSQPTLLTSTFSADTVSTAGTTGQKKPSRKPPASSTNKKKSCQESSAENDQISFLTTELNYAHTRIVAQDNSMKDLECKIKILKESLRLAEEKLNSGLHEKYFGTQYPQPSCCSWSHPPSHSSCCSTACRSTRSGCAGISPSLHSVPPSQSHCPLSTNPTQQSETGVGNYKDIKTSIGKLVSQVDQMKIDIKNISSKINSILIPSTNSDDTAIPEIYHDADVHFNDDHDITLASMDEDITETEQNPCRVLNNPTNQSN